MFQKDSLEQTIARLISQKQEGDFWDFKREWHEDDKKADFVKDIICFANSIHSKDCYLIFGVDDNYKIVGMKGKRKNQADIIDLLSHIQWAGDNEPQISLKTIILERKELDVLIIHNTENVPYYLRKDYEKKGHCIRQGVIYSRMKDRNTGFNDIASPWVIEKLWKKRFHLHEPIIEQLYKLLANYNEWDYGSDNILYHRYRPEFTIREKTNDLGTSYNEFFTELMPSPASYSHTYQLKYNESTLKDIYLLYLDGSRFITPYPQTEYSNSIVKNRYFYVIKNSPEWNIQCIFNKDSGGNHEFSQEMFLNNLVLYSSESEKDNFHDWCICNPALIETVKKEITINKKFNNKSFYEDAFTTKLMKELLKKYRNKESS